MFLKSGLPVPTDTPQWAVENSPLTATSSKPSEALIPRQPHLPKAGRLEALVGAPRRTRCRLLEDRIERAIAICATCLCLRT